MRSRNQIGTLPEVQGDKDEIVVQQKLGPVKFGVTGPGDPSATVEPDHDRISTGIDERWRFGVRKSWSVDV